MRARVGACDREAKPAAGFRAAREALEKARAQVLGHAVAAVLDRDPEVPSCCSAETTEWRLP